MVLTSNLSLRY